MHPVSSLSSFFIYLFIFGTGGPCCSPLCVWSAQPGVWLWLAQHNDLMTWLWIVPLAYLRLENSDTQLSGLRRLWISGNRAQHENKGTKVHKTKGSINFFRPTLLRPSLRSPVTPAPGPDQSEVPAAVTWPALHQSQHAVSSSGEPITGNYWRRYLG